jgi:hypothetical protein
MSEPHLPQDSTDSTVLENLDEFVDVADALLGSDILAARRRKTVLNVLKSVYDIAPTYRLAYRPQPVPEQVPGFASLTIQSHNRVPDLSLSFLQHDINIFKDDSIRKGLNTLAKELSSHKIHLMTCMDAASHLAPPQCHGEIVEAAAYLVEETVKIIKNQGQGIWMLGSNGSPDLLDRMWPHLSNCMGYACFQRLMFCEARRKGDTLATFHTDMYELRKIFHIPEDFDVLQMLYALGGDLARELERIDNLWEANVELEWDCQPIPVEEVTTPLEHTEGIDCVVCTDTMTPPGLQTPCGHKYCKDCLQSWIHACRPTSHLCPYCRQILFAKPKYRPKEPGGHELRT